MNAIGVALSSEESDKSSKLSVAITIVGIVSVLVLLWYLGAFAPKELRESKYIIKETNTVNMGKQNTMVYGMLLDFTKTQIFSNELEDTIYFAKMNKNYQIIEKYFPKKNCSGKNNIG